MSEDALAGGPPPPANKRPIAVLVIACVYLLIGLGGFASHLYELTTTHPLRQDELWVSLLSLLAAIAGTYMLRGHNWARWLAVAWIALHFAISIFHAWPELLVHAALLAVFAFFLFRLESNRYFRTAAH